jgi:dephospho-CoA kinase
VRDEPDRHEKQVTEAPMEVLFERCTALTGGIATGKSTVASMMTEMGARLIDTDRIARQIVEPGRPALESIVREFGAGVRKPDGTLDREAVRNEIIRHPEKRDLLNSLTHPEINKEVVRLIRGYRAEGDTGPIIIDVPLLFEVRWHTLFNKIVLVYVPVHVQLERLMKRDGLAAATAEMTLKAQMSIEEKRALSTFIIDNSGSLDETREQVRRIYPSLSVHNSDAETACGRRL